MLVIDQSSKVGEYQGVVIPHPRVQDPVQSTLAQLLAPRVLGRDVAATGEIEYVERQLSDLPLITYSERDAAPYFTSAMFLAKEPGTGIQNLSFHRSMYVSNGELRCRLAPRHHLTLYHEKAEKDGQYLEAAMLIGPPPTTFLTAAAPLPYDADEMVVAAQLLGAPIPMRRCKHVDLMVPATAEITRKYCMCMNEKMENNEKQSITQWEKSHPQERAACDKEAGWK